VLSPREEVADVSSDLEAARLRLDFEHALRRPTTTADEAAEYRDAIAELDDRWPRAGEEAVIATDEELYGSRAVPRGHRELRATLRREARVSATEAAKRRRSRAGGSSSSSSSRRSSSSSGGRVRAAAGAAGRAYRSRPSRALGVQDVGGGLSDITLAFLRVGLGLALVYFLLTSRGSRGLGAVLGAVSGGVRLFVAPADPLKPGTLGALSGAPARAPARATAPPTGPGSTDLPHGMPAHVTGPRSAQNARSLATRRP
jgi:hypothetical protein